MGDTSVHGPGEPALLVRHRKAVALALTGALFVLLVFTQREMGFTRDESVYFEAGERYAAWFDDLAERPLAALGDEVIRQRFEYNREHPALPKLLFGASHRLFAEKLGWTSHALGFRLPALLLAALLAALVFLLGLRISTPGAALFAAVATVAAPRHFYHLHLASFDVPATTTWVLVVYAYWRSLEPGAGRRWGILTGLSFGLAIAVKHNAYFLPFLLVAHWLLMHGPDAWRAGGWRERLGRVPLAFPAMALVGPAVLFVSWPFLWHAPIERFVWYVAFHAKHVHYSWQYLGEVLRQPPFPIAYPFVVTGLTLSVPLLVPVVAGLALGFWRVLEGGAVGAAVRRALRRGVADAQVADARVAGPAAPGSRSALVLVLLNGLFPIVLIASPSVPIFGGMKHWLPAMPFLLLLAGEAVGLAAGALPPARRPTLRPLVAGALGALLLVPTALSAWHFHPYGTSAYNALAGGLPGAADLGMQRQYWSNAVTGVLPWMNDHARRGARVYLHEVTYPAFRWYQRDGRLRGDLRWAGDPEASDLAAYQYHQEFRDREFETWSVYGTRTPVTGVYLDGVPLVVVYARPGQVADAPAVAN